MSPWLAALRCSLIAGLFPCLMPQPARAVQQPSARERTAHYELDVAGSQAEARELGRLLEEAWRQFAEFFRVEPRLKKDERFVVRLAADKEHWTLDLAAGGGVPPAGLDFLWYRPETETVYLYRQGSDYLTRCLLIYGATQQFHSRCKAKNEDLLHSWFANGLAAHFSIHRWDGARLELGAHPQICMLDYATKALSELDPGTIGFKRFTDEHLRPPEVSWAVVRFLLAGEGGRHRRSFEKLALGHRGSKLTGEEFAQSLGLASPLSARVYDWLRTVQQPWQTATGEWEELTAELVRARAPRNEYALCPSRSELAALAFLVRPDDKSAAGALFDYRGTQDFMLAMIQDSRLTVGRVGQGGLADARFHDLEPLREGWHRLKLTRDDAALHLEADGRLIELLEPRDWRMGLVAADGGAHFRELSASR